MRKKVRRGQKTNMAMEAGKELQKIVLVLCIQPELRKLPSSYRLKHCRSVRCIHLHKQKKPLPWFFLPFFLSASEIWVLLLARGLNSCSGERSGVWFRKRSFLSLASLPNVLQPCPIKIYSSQMFLVVTLCSAAVGLLCAPRLSPRRSKPENHCSWEDQPAEPCWTVNQALKAQPF